MKQQLYKPNAMKNTTMLIEVVGFLLILLLLSWSTVRNPLVMVEIYAHYLRELAVFRFSTNSVFIIGNLIIIVVVVQSTKLAPAPTRKIVRFVRHQYVVPEQNMKFVPLDYNVADHIMNFGPRQEKTECLTSGEFYFPDRKTTHNMSKRTLPSFDTDRSVSRQSSIILHKAVEAEKVSAKQETSQLYRRTQSASYERGGAKRNKINKPELTRSETVRLGGGKGMNGGNVRMLGRFDELNHDEFRRKIESFIAKQRKMIREEMVVGDTDLA